MEEYPVDRLDISAAQRYSVLVTARNDDTPSNWAVHADMEWVDTNLLQGFANGFWSPEMFDAITDDNQLSESAAVGIEYELTFLGLRNDINYQIPGPKAPSF